METLAPTPDAAPHIHVSEAPELGVPIAWHEAVAIVRVLAVAAQRQAPPIELPALSQIAVDTSGRLLVTGGASVGRDAVPALRALLRHLIDEQTTPGELVNLLNDSEGSGEHTDLAEFIARLTFFARPDDTAELADFAARVLAYRESYRRDEALVSLTRRTRAATLTAPTPPAAAPNARKRNRIRGWSLGVLLLVAIVAAATAWRLAAASTGRAGPMPAPVAELARRVQDELAVTMTALQERFGLAPQPDVPAGRDRQLPTVQRRAPRPPVGAERMPLPAEFAYGLVAPAAGAAALPVPSQAPRVGAPEPPADLTVYSAHDPSVVGPTLARPQMPAERIEGISQERAGELELLVGLDGRVEQARLVPASNRYQDRMMVSAAKTWRFAPATRDGRPVRYRFRMPITW